MFVSKVLGESEGFAEQIQRLKDFEFNRELEQQLGKYAPKTNSAVPDLKDSTLLNQGISTQQTRLSWACNIIKGGFQ